MRLPSIHDFAREAHDPARYGLLPEDWSIAVADVVASTDLAGRGRDRDVNFVAGAVVAALAQVATLPDLPAACQFGGDGAVAAIPPGREEHARQVLAALAHWAKEEMQIPLRAGLVPVAALDAAGHPVLAALQDFGGGNVFGQFLGTGVAMAEHWVKSDEAWRLAPAPGDIPGLEGLSCRWRPVPPSRGIVLCVIVDPLRPGAEAYASLTRLQAAIEAIVPTALAAPLGDGGGLIPALAPTPRLLGIELRAHETGSRLPRLMRALAGTFILGLIHRLGGRLGGVDTGLYVRAMAERSDYRKQAGGPRFVLDVTEDEAQRIDSLLSAAEARGEVTYGMARSVATTITCMVGDFSADRHVHFVDGADLGFWRASQVLKAKRAA